MEETYWLVTVHVDDAEDGSWSDDYVVVANTSKQAIEKTTFKFPDADSVIALSVDVRSIGTSEDIIR